MDKVIKPKKCKQCKESFTPQRPLQFICSPTCAIDYANNKKEQDWKQRKLEIKKSLKTSSDYKKDLEKEINQIVRLIDKGHECISSKATNYTINAGHLYSVGSYPALRFNLLNIYSQSVGDNLYKGGNGVIYKERIKEVFGEEVSDEIENLKIRYPEIKLSVPELEEAIGKAKGIVKTLKKIADDHGKPFSTYLRINMRRKINEQIGIYL